VNELFARHMNYVKMDLSVFYLHATTCQLIHKRLMKMKHQNEGMNATEPFRFGVVKSTAKV
jgi:hypothetical protein